MDVMEGVLCCFGVFHHESESELGELALCVSAADDCARDGCAGVDQSASSVKRGDVFGVACGLGAHKSIGVISVWDSGFAAVLDVCVVSAREKSVADEAVSDFVGSGTGSKEKSVEVSRVEESRVEEKSVEESCAEGEVNTELERDVKESLRASDGVVEEESNGSFVSLGRMLESLASLATAAMSASKESVSDGCDVVVVVVEVVVEAESKLESKLESELEAESTLESESDQVSEE